MKKMLKNAVLAFIAMIFLLASLVLFFKLLQLPICERVWFYLNPEARIARCVSNLRMIESAKEEYRLENNLTNGAIVVKEQINKYILSGGVDGLVCPSGGKYTINAIGVDATCSIREHKLYGSVGSNNTSNGK